MRTLTTLILLSSQILGQNLLERNFHDLLDRTTSRFTQASTLHYKSRYSASNPTQDSTFRSEADIWLEKLPSDSIFHSRFHAKGLDANGPFDYFYDGQNALEIRHNTRNAVIFNPHLYPADTHNPAKARTALSPFVALFVEPRPKEFLFQGNPFLKIDEQQSLAFTNLSFAYPENSLGQTVTLTLSISRTLEISQIVSQLRWRGIVYTYETQIDNFELNPTFDPTELIPSDNYNSYESTFFSGYETKGIDTSSSSLRGTFASDFTYSDLNEHSLNLASQKGRFVLIDFWEPWCGSCLFSIPKVKALRDTYPQDQLTIMGITTDSPNLVRRLAKLNNLNYPTLLADKDILRRYKISQWPTYLLVDPEGRVVEISFGDLNAITSMLKSLVK